MRKIGLISIMFLLVIGFVYLTFTNTSQKMSSGIIVGEINTEGLSDGMYVGEYETKIVKAKVQVQVKDERIDEIIILSHDNGLGKPAERIVDDIEQSQSLEVDNVSGATISSKVIKKAVENALDKK